MVKSAAAMPGMVNRAFRMMIGTMLSRVLGLLRETLIAAFFGATRTLDAYNVAYTLANLSRQLLAEGALSASFVPVFSRVLGQKGERGALGLSRQVLSVLLAACTAAVAAGIIASPLLVRVIAPGFDDDLRVLAVSLTRALFPFLLLVSVAALAMGVLNSAGSFFVPAVAPAASNLAFIVLLLVFRKNISVWTIVAAVLSGGFCSLALQWGAAWRMGYLLVPARPDTRDPALRQTLSLFLPYAAGLSMNQINPVVSRVLGSFLGGGTISVLNFADRIIQLPLGLFVIAISQAVLPMLSRLDEGDREGFRVFIRDALRFNLFIVLPASIALMILARPVVHIILVRGAFGARAWAATSGALACYAAGLPGMACNTILMRALYARRLPRAAVASTALTVTANLALGLSLMGRFSHLGLAAGTSGAFTIAAFFAAWKLSRDIDEKIGLFEIKWMTRLVFPCAVLAAGLFAASRLVPYPAEAALAVRAAWMAAAALAGGALYVIATGLIRCPEWTWIKDALKKTGADKKS